MLKTRKCVQIEWKFIERSQEMIRPSLSVYHFLTLHCLSCTLASCRIMRIKHNHLHQLLKIGYHNLMALKYKQNNVYVRGQRLPSSWLVFCAPSLTIHLNLFTVCLSAKMKNSIFVVYRESDLLICNWKESTISFLTCSHLRLYSLCSSSLILFQVLSLRAVQVFRLTGGIPIDPSIWQSSVCEAWESFLRDTHANTQTHTWR